MSAVTLRDATAADAETLIAFLQALNAHEATISGDRDLGRDAAERCHALMLEKNAAQGGEIIIAEIGGRPAGFVCWRIDLDEPYVVPELIRHAEIAELYVDPAHRRAGIGRGLLAEAERRINAAGLPRYFIGVLVGNDGAEAAYRAAGFAPYLTLMAKDLR